MNSRIEFKKIGFARPITFLVSCGSETVNSKNLRSSSRSGPLVSNSTGPVYTRTIQLYLIRTAYNYLSDSTRYWLPQWSIKPTSVRFLTSRCGQHGSWRGAVSRKSFIQQCESPDGIADGGHSISRSNVICRTRGLVCAIKFDLSPGR